MIIHASLPPPSDATAIEIVRRGDRVDPIDNRRLRRSLDAGSWVRVAPGAFTTAGAWRTLTPLDRHRHRVLEVTRRLRPPAVISHFAAASEWGIDILGRWPDTVDVITARANGGRSGGFVRRHARGFDDVEVIPFGEHFVTTPAQTALDLGRALPFTEAVAAIDQAVWSRRRRGALTTTFEVCSLLQASGSHRGDVRAARAISFSSHLADNVRESESRVVIARLGFPAPRLQERRVLPSGRTVYGDFFFPSHDHWGELDGLGKYRDRSMTRGRDTADIVIDEKRREDEIRREVRGFSRWVPADAATPRRLYDILTRDGLPSTLPPP